jgi:DNA polymerase-3 subunit delta
LSAHLLYGDSFLVSRTLRDLEAESGAADLLEANTHRLAGAQVKPAELLSICLALPFMDSCRLVIIDGLLALGERQASRAGGRTRAGNRTPAGSGNILGEWQAWAESISGMPETTLLIFKDGPLSDTNPLLRSLLKVAEPHHLTAPSGEGLARWMKTTAGDKGTGISPVAINSLMDLIGNDLWTLDQELEKLALYASGRNIEEDDVRQMVSQAKEANIFNAVDAMIAGRPDVALDLLRQLREDGREAPYIIGMIGRQLRLMALARDLTERGVPQGEMGKRLGVASQYAVQKTVEQARRHSGEDLSWRYRRLLETDLSIKRGRLNPDMALELLVAELAGG